MAPTIYSHSQLKRHKAKDARATMSQELKSSCHTTSFLNGLKRKCDLQGCKGLYKRFSLRTLRSFSIFIFYIAIETTSRYTKDINYIHIINDICIFSTKVNQQINNVKIMCNSIKAKRCSEP